jgi:hypothetical protein
VISGERAAHTWMQLPTTAAGLAVNIFSRTDFAWMLMFEDV